MSAKSERTKNRKVKLVGGGTRWTRSRASESGGSLKSQRRKLRHGLKRNKRTMSVAERKVIKEQIASLMAHKDGR